MQSTTKFISVVSGKTRRKPTLTTNETTSGLKGISDPPHELARFLVCHMSRPHSYPSPTTVSFADILRHDKLRLNSSSRRFVQMSSNCIYYSRNYTKCQWTTFTFYLHLILLFPLIATNSVIHSLPLGELITREDTQRVSSPTQTSPTSSRSE